MVVTNKELLELACMELDFMYDGENLFTYNEWKKRGYQVKKGEKCFIKTKLWKSVPLKNEVENNKDKQKNDNKCIMTTACLFTINQVEPIK